MRWRVGGFSRTSCGLVLSLIVSLGCSEDRARTPSSNARLADADVAEDTSQSAEDAAGPNDAEARDAGSDSGEEPRDAMIAPDAMTADAMTAPDARTAPDAMTPDAMTAPDATAPDATAPDATAPDAGVAGDVGPVNRNYAQWPMPDSRTLYCSNGTTPIACPSLGQPGYGQDGNYSLEVATYSTTQDTVEDSVTGLVWQRTDLGANLDWAGAVAFCESLVHAGHDDWRLPAAIELMSLADMGDQNGHLDETIFPGLSEVYWSSTLYAWYEANKWSVSLGTGFRDYASIGLTLRAMCVRGGQARSGPRYMTAADVVTDNFTGLIWQKGWAPMTVSWLGALQYCQDLVLDGESDWRLPSLKELHTSFDDHQTMPGIDSNAFPGTPAGGSDYFWSSTPHYYYDEVVWAVKYQFGTTEAYFTTGQFSDTGRARCVR
ncbi:MAG: DUF1566 domain-containing protein [Deltaproteobacteria bacterium]|nr:DUF1566 domain-containing protein [Deltaproteobacteria bacterium]